MEDKLRKLDIGPGWNEGHKMKGFETLDYEERANVDHVADASGPLPFDDNTFDLIHASHILEHIPWQHSERTLKEWVRILKPGGTMEIWVPNGLEICRGWVQAEKGNAKTFEQAKRLWKRKGKDPAQMANGLIFSFKGINCPPWGFHKAMFSEKYLKRLMKKAGLTHVVRMSIKQDMREVRPGFLKKRNRERRHEWVNFGMRGIKCQ